jgi:hypothetical protein
MTKTFEVEYRGKKIVSSRSAYDATDAVLELLENCGEADVVGADQLESGGYEVEYRGSHQIEAADNDAAQDEMCRMLENCGFSNITKVTELETEVCK